MKSTILYCTNEENTARFVLGEDGKNPLVCVGVNPNTAITSFYDPTMTTLLKVSEMFGFDEYVMMNLYPQRSKNPNEIHDQINKIFVNYFILFI